MTNYNERLDEILDYLLTDIYMNNEHFAANQEALDKTKEEPMQAIKSLISKAYMQGLTDATADPSTMTPKEVFERNQRINEHSKRRE